MRFVCGPLVVGDAAFENTEEYNSMKEIYCGRDYSGLINLVMRKLLRTGMKKKHPLYIYCTLLTWISANTNHGLVPWGCG